MVNRMKFWFQLKIDVEYYRLCIQIWVKNGDTIQVHLIKSWCSLSIAIFPKSEYLYVEYRWEEINIHDGTSSLWRRWRISKWSSVWRTDVSAGRVCPLQWSVNSSQAIWTSRDKLKISASSLEFSSWFCATPSSYLTRWMWRLQNWVKNFRHLVVFIENKHFCRVYHLLRIILFA